MKLSMDSPAANIAEQIADLLVAGFLWLLCSLPVVTIGPATAALYYTVVKVVRRKRDTVTSAFFHSFRGNLRQGIGLTVLYLAYGAVLAAYGLLWGRLGEAAVSPYAYAAAGILLGAPFLFTIVYIFPIMSRFDAGMARQLQYALHMSVGHPLATLVLILWLAAVLCCAYLFSFSLLVLPGICAFVSSLLIEPVFRKYLKKEREKYADSDDLPWYLE